MSDPSKYADAPTTDELMQMAYEALQGYLDAHDIEIIEMQPEAADNPERRILIAAKGDLADALRQTCLLVSTATRQRRVGEVKA